MSGATPWPRKQQVARMSEAICEGIGANQNPDIASLIRATLADPGHERTGEQHRACYVAIP